MNSMNQSRVMPWLLLLLSAFVAGCGSDAGRDPILGIGADVVAAAPTVTAVTPADGATGVALNTTITATFSEPVQALTAANFTVTCEAPCVNPTGTISMNSAGTVATFTLSSGTLLRPLTQYTGTVSGATSIATGLSMEAPFTWRFTTTATPPVVTSVAPSNNATGVPVNNTVISAQFSEPVVALTGANFTVTCEDPCTSPTGTISMNSTSRVATFVADADLEPQTQYTATVSDAESIASGLTMVNPFVWRFTTAQTPDTTRPRVTLTVPATTDPGPTTDVPTNTAITAAFTEEMDPLTIDDTSFTLTCDAPCVAPDGVVSYTVGSAIATFKPDPPGTLLEDNTTYTATITDAATDLAGNQLAGNQAPLPDPSDYVWTFTTSVAVEPQPVTVVDTNPVDGDVDVCPSASVSAIFDAPSGERMDPDSLTPNTFLLVEVAPGSPVVDAASVTLDQATGLTATFKPLDLLVEGTTYRATIVSGANGVKDLAIPANEMENDFSWEFTVGPDTGACLAQIDMGLATPFAIAATAGLTNTPTAPITTINGDVVLDPNFTCNAVSVPNDGTFGLCGGSPPTLNGQVITNTFPDTTTSGFVKDDLNAAFLSITPSAGPPAAGSLDGGTPLPAPTTLGAETGSALVFLDNYFTPGVYTSGTSILITDDILLDAQGNPDAVFVFQSASTLTTEDGAASPGVHTRILLTGGAKASNVWWQVASSATIGTFTEFEGNILAAFDITLKTGATSCGRMMSGAWEGGSGAIVLDSNLVSVPGNGCPE